MFPLKLSRKNMVKLLVFLGLSGLFFPIESAVLAAEDYPVRPITIHVGFPPGAVSGLIAQAYSEGMKKYLPKPQPVLINYKPGASGAIAADFVLKQPADGYNLFSFPVDLCVKLAKDGHLLHFKLEDFAHIGTSGSSPCCLMVNKEGPYKKFEDFIENAKKNPGKLSYGTPGVGSLVHLVGEVFQDRCGIKLNHIPFSGGAAGVTAVLGGHIDSYLGSVAAAGTHIKPGGGLRVLAIFAQERFYDLPDVPTSLEKGYEVDIMTWHGLAAPKKTPQAVLDVLIDAFKKMGNDSHVRETLMNVGYTPSNWGPEEAEKRAKKEFELSRAVFKKLGLVE